MLLSVGILLAKHVNARVYIFCLFFFYFFFFPDEPFPTVIKPIAAAHKVKSIKEEVLLCAVRTVTFLPVQVFGS